MSNVTNRDFVVAYATAYNLDDVAKATGMTRSQISARRKFLENKGVIFPRLKAVSALTPLDVAQLNSLIKKHNVKRDI